MQLAQWSQEYETGFSIIDQQHRQMFELVNQLQAAIVEQSHIATIQHLLQQLLEDTIEHFSLEEKLMREYDYPSYQQHKQIHDRLTQKIRKVLHAIEADQDTKLINTELSHFLHQWLVHHIQGQDQKMIQFFRQKNLCLFSNITS